jgi:hypothetical protein
MHGNGLRRFHLKISVIDGESLPSVLDLDIVIVGNTSEHDAPEAQHR